jgi:hypothetical protein
VSCKEWIYYRADTNYAESGEVSLTILLTREMASLLKLLLDLLLEAIPFILHSNTISQPLAIMGKRKQEDLEREQVAEQAAQAVAAMEGQETEIEEPEKTSGSAGKKVRKEKVK